jgi:C1A family cysteine protease
MKITRQYGWLPDLPDKRNLLFRDTARIFSAASLPSGISLKSGCPPVYDQLQEGSCTANAASGDIGFQRHKQGLPYLIPSRNFIYWNTRELEGSTASDSGASISDTFKAIAAEGICSEHRWPYNDATLLPEPTLDCYAAAVPHRTLKYLSVAQTVAEMLTCLAAGYPFEFGITVYDSFESDASAVAGVIPMPKLSTESSLGGHALLAVGYDQPSQRIIFRNSWGASWGAAGYGTIPFAYLTDPDLASDFWTIRLEE